MGKIIKSPSPVVSAPHNSIEEKEPSIWKRLVRLVKQLPKLLVLFVVNSFKVFAALISNKLCSRQIEQVVDPISYVHDRDEYEHIYDYNALQTQFSILNEILFSYIGVTDLSQKQCEALKESVDSTLLALFEACAAEDGTHWEQQKDSAIVETLSVERQQSVFYVDDLTTFLGLILEQFSGTLLTRCLAGFVDLLPAAVKKLPEPYKPLLAFRDGQASVTIEWTRPINETDIVQV